MRLAAITTLVAAFLAGSAVADRPHGRNVALHARRAANLKHPSYPDLQARYGRDASGSHIRASSTYRTAPAANVQLGAEATLSTAAWIRVQAVSVLNTFKADLSAHVSIVQSICAQAEATADATLRASLAIKLKAELEAVLAIIINARVGIQNCKSSPQPSQPPSTGVPSITVIIDIIIAIFVQLKAILTVVIRACASISIFESTCANLLESISAEASLFLTVCGQVLGIDVLVQLRAQLLSIFNLTGYGLQEVRSVLSGLRL